MIETERLQLIPCDIKHFEALISNQGDFQRLFNFNLAEGWLVFPEAMSLGHDYLKQHPQVLGWWIYLFIHKPDKTLIGCGGFKGAPDEHGMVEIGYAIAPAYENQGLATEVARALTNFAFSHEEVQMVDAHTLAEINGSTKVLQKAGMTKIAEKHDPDDGSIWQWRINRK